MVKEFITHLRNRITGSVSYQIINSSLEIKIFKPSTTFKFYIDDYKFILSEIGAPYAAEYIYYLYVTEYFIDNIRIHQIKSNNVSRETSEE